MRIKKEKVEINYKKVQAHFATRAEKYNEQYPYMTTMLQDSHPQLTEERTIAETIKILPELQLTNCSRVLDIGCGIGRWADAIGQDIEAYLGVDYMEDFIKIAKERNQKPQFQFEAMSAMDFPGFFREKQLQKFDRCIISGVFAYLNDNDVETILRMLPEVLTSGSIFYLREPVGIETRLTLKDFYSEELAHEYSGIYRTADEYRQMMQESIPGLRIMEEGSLFEKAELNNRKETRQYYLLVRCGDIS